VRNLQQLMPIETVGSEMEQALDIEMPHPLKNAFPQATSALEGHVLIFVF
jgi:hypothetical protein